MPVATPARPHAAASDDGVYAAGNLIAAKYRLKRRLGVGGMGDVWLAENTALHVDVAIKLIRAEIAGSDEAAQRLLNEARAAARIDHPAIVRVNDFGATEQDDPFIVMELLKGYTLEELIEREAPLEPTRVVAMLLPIFDALAAAHPKGIIHRDLKPDNIFLCEDARGAITPKLVDFGIARLGERIIESDEIPVHLDVPQMRARIATRVTQMGQILGSPGYMSPEQVRADREIDGRADIWGMGVVLYQALSGRLPFDGDNAEKVLMAVLCEAPEPPADLDVELWNIVARALSKDRRDRFRDAHDMGVALARWLAANGVDEDITGRNLKGWLGTAAPRSSQALVPTAMSHSPPMLAAERQRLLPRAVLAAVALGMVAAILAAVLLTDETRAPDAPASASAAATTADDVPTALPSEPDSEAETDGEPAEAAPAPPPKSAPTPRARAAPRNKRPAPRAAPAPAPAPKAAPTGAKGKLPIPEDVPF